ncbi:GDSL-type esterase/lipase family protein [Streptomyces sp. 549]|uniref:GDSL-type esterase/lipase family protein n=1 Tax=Streptomyces sp. 549 TaxID=3049076 RepID=UPI0024C20DA8|nr:GDSL-type esterase/lipase family protein [Streptomyces sp. 549]MDK1476164.1 GDSL-type esterase/lipase family protein [Streptomyces sp. 549]
MHAAPSRTARCAAALLGVLALTLLTASPSAAHQAAPASPLAAPAASAPAYDPTARPTAIVGIGDSLTSGEGGGSYRAGRAPGQWCHRSAHAQVELARPPGVDTTVNLACSGAGTDHVRLGGSRHYGERPQTEALADVTRTHDVRSIVLTVGANDIPVAGLAVECALRFLTWRPACADRWDTELPKRLTALQPRIEQNLRDIRTVMRRSGRPDDSYDLILQSYASPSGGVSRHSLLRRAAEGCPFSDRDMRWVRDTMFPALTATSAKVAAAVPGVRFLDLTHALDGRQVCAPGTTRKAELSWGVHLDPTRLVHGPGPNLVAHSLHPNAAGHRELARCLAQFHTHPDPSATCVRPPGPDRGPQLAPRP